MARKLIDAIDDIKLVAEYFGFDISQMGQFRAAARIEIDMNEKVKKLIIAL